MDAALFTVKRLAFLTFASSPPLASQPGGYTGPPTVRRSDRKPLRPAEAGAEVRTWSSLLVFPTESTNDHVWLLLSHVTSMFAASLRGEPQQLDKLLETLPGVSGERLQIKGLVQEAARCTQFKLKGTVFYESIFTFLYFIFFFFLFFIVDVLKYYS